MNRASLSCLLLLLSHCEVSHVAAADAPWNRFRGPDGEGVHRAAEPPVEFGPDKNVLWKTPIHGRGWSSPVVLGDRVWLTTATDDGTRLSALCLDLATGEVLWDRVVFQVAEPRFCHPSNSYASCTSFVEAGRLYVHFGSYGTACLDPQTGATLWERRDFVCDDWRGPASSPIVHGGLLIVHFDGVDFQFLVGLDKQTGETVWRRDRDIDYGTEDGDYKKAYSTPLVIRAGGVEQLVSPASAETIAYRLPEATPLWRIHHNGVNASAPPLYDGERVYITGGRGPLAITAVRPDGEGDITDSHVEWGSGKSVPRWSAPLLWDGLLFTTDGRGVALCRDAVTGEMQWTERLGGSFWSSPVAAAGRVYAFNQAGEGVVFAAQREYRELARVDLADEINATPAIVGDTLLVRTLGTLYRFGGE